MHLLVGTILLLLGLIARPAAANDETATQTIWQSANWLDRIQETPPPADEAAEDEDASFQAA